MDTLYEVKEGFYLKFNPEMITVIAQITEPQRMYDFCKGKFEALPSHKSVKKAIENGLLLLNNQQVGTGKFVQEGDIVTLTQIIVNKPQDYHFELHVVYEDDDIAIIEKPAGIPVSGNSFKTILNMLGGNLKPSPMVDVLPWPVPSHRLDVPTQGLLICAKTVTANKSLGEMFREKLIRKTYHALVAGKPSPSEGMIDDPIDGKAAISEYETLKTVPSLSHEQLSWVQLSPLTGRTHQLRIHMSGKGCPIIGDLEYGPWTKRHKGLFLAAVGISLNHPRTGEVLTITIPTPAKFETYLNREQERFEKMK